MFLLYYLSVTSCDEIGQSRGRIERIYSRVQQPYKFIGTKESVYKAKEFNSHRIGLVHQHGRHFSVLEHQYGCHDVM